MVRWACNTLSLPASILDLGCGQGAASWFFARQGFDVTAVDGSANALAKAQTWLTGEGYPIRAQVCCVTALPFEAGTFDAVVDVVCSAHNSMIDMVKIFAEIARVLKPGGKVFSVMPTNRCSRRPFKGLGTISFMEHQEVDMLLDKGFDGVSILSSSYQLSQDCFVENWIVTASRK